MDGLMSVHCVIGIWNLEPGNIFGQNLHRVSVLSTLMAGEGQALH